MHFFHPIRQSGLHVYHSALPLSPILSPLRSTIPSITTQIQGLHGCPDTWGAVVQTIKGGPEGFTCMAVIGHKIVTACNDGTVSIYDSATGVPRLSLTTRDSVRAIGGSVDGSILFCTHQQPSITSWDVQTGGLIHTFTLEEKTEVTAISTKGRYIARGLSDGSVRVWDVAKNAEGGALWSGSPVSQLCWLEEEEHLAVAKQASVHIWDIVSGSTLRRFATQDPIRGVLYSQNLNQLAVITTSEARDAITIIHSQKGESFTTETQQQLSCFAFSQTAEEVVCGGSTPGLELFSTKERSWRHFDHPAAIASISASSNWTVTNVAGSGIQLLDLGWQYTPSQPLTVPALAVDAFDEGRIIALLSTTRDRTILLESIAMLQLFTIPTQNVDPTQTNHTPVLCAVLKHRVAVFCLEEGDKWRLWLWRFDRELPEWTVEVSELPSVGGVSPSGARLVTFHDVDHQTHVCMRDTQNGQLQAHLLIGQSSPAAHPLGIKFESEDKFYSHHHSYRTPYVISSSNSGTPSDSIIRYQQLPSAGESRRYYDVDDAREWVVASSKRVCWIPPGYIGSGQRNYCWAGNALVMVGEDGTLRAIRFREPFI